MLLDNEVFHRVLGFYPATLGPREYLSYYSRIFDLAAVGVQAVQAWRESISSVIEQLLNKFSFDDLAHAVRKVVLRVMNLVSAHEEESQIKMQKTILDYMSMPDMLSDI